MLQRFTLLPLIVQALRTVVTSIIWRLARWGALRPSAGALRPVAIALAGKRA
jgi:hypothetical protein